MFLYYIITALGGAIIALTIYIAVYRLVYKGRANSIIEKATADAENIKQSKMLEAKEHFLQLKSDYDRKVNDKNNQLRHRENNIRSKETSLNQLSS